jgi:hypothetical protein
MNDRARQCAEELKDAFQSYADIDGVIAILNRHFPPNVPMSKLEEFLVTCETYDAPTWIQLRLKTLIAEAKP